MITDVHTEQRAALRVYEDAIAEGTTSIAILTRLHRRLERLGTNEDDIDTACRIGFAQHELTVRTNAPRATA